ncbi:hypothetical protein JTB14_007257 [Gonioctena quinquepunctata]|nr:hypothetical protein JTB14_007257 [Gonioctena quinquepunctata]
MFICLMPTHQALIRNQNKIVTKKRLRGHKIEQNVPDQNVPDQNVPDQNEPEQNEPHQNDVPSTSRHNIDTPVLQSNKKHCGSTYRVCNRRVCRTR